MAVIVGVENNGALRVGRGQFSKNDGAAAGDGQEMRFDAAGFEHFDEVSGIFLDVGGVAGDVGDGEKFGELADDAVFVVHAIVADFLGDFGGFEWVRAFGRRRDFLRGGGGGESGE